LNLSHLQALKIEIHTVKEQCIVGSPTLTIYRVNNKENMYVPVVYNNRLSKHIRGLLEKYPTFSREKETGLLGVLDT
jgi:hypothetical protein